MQQIVIVGGGAGGLELATKLGRKYGKKNRARIVLVDSRHTHLWKPLLHEVATGSLDAGVDELNYLAHGKKHGFKFHLGKMCGLDRAKQRVILAPIVDKEEQILPQRSIEYSQLIIAIGSVSNDFNTQGAAENCWFLDNREQAELFRKKLFNKILQAGSSTAVKKLHLAIVGAGATGVELSAEMHNAAEQLGVYGMSNFDRSKLKVNLIEAGDRILPALPEKLSSQVALKLEQLGVKIYTNTMITKVSKEGFITKDNKLIKAKLRVWAAGVRGADFLKNLDGLTSNNLNQLIVKPTLQTVDDEHIFAIGDCASLTFKDGSKVPPRAQAAHQQAAHIVKVLQAQSKNKPLPHYKYQDYGSMISLSTYSAVGNLIGKLSGKQVMLQGKVAKTIYVSLYRLHQIALHGYWNAFLLTLVGHINKVIKPKIKLH